MVSVEVRFLSEGRWQPVTLPISVQVARTLAQAAKAIGLGDVVKGNRSSEPSRIGLQT
jgi:hypothetical protein